MSVSIINSQGFWQNGWLPNSSTLNYFVSILERQGLEVQTYEVKHIGELESLLLRLDPHTLILPNAYHVNPHPEGDQTDLIWMSDVIAQHDFRSIGPQAACLKQLLQKHVCQGLLQANGVPVPEFCFIGSEETENAAALLEKAGMTYPAIVKPSGESSGLGISEDSIVYDGTAALAQIRALHADYKQGIIVESYLPGTEFTAARFEANGQPLYLIAEYQVENGSILGHKERSLTWGEGRRMVKVEDGELLREIGEVLDKVWHALGIKDVFRLDGRLDNEGRFRVFDVNGFPALSYQQSATPILCETCFPDFSAEEVYRMLANTIVLCAAQREGVEVPPALSENNFFTASRNSKAVELV